MPGTMTLPRARPRPALLGADGRPLRGAEAQGFVAGARRAYARGVRAGYDAAQTTDDNKRHWTNADALSADAALSSGVRRTLRNRARYEVANHAWLDGMIQTLANYCIGAGPTLQFNSGDETVNDAVEYEFASWARAVQLGTKLRVARGARCFDGEVFGLLVYNPGVRHDVKLDVVLVEADRVTEPGMSFDPRANLDGILYDEYGNPVRYRILKTHPGDTFAQPTDYDEVSAENVLHFFRIRRAGQRRGVTEFASSLETFPQIRRYSRAVILAAEWAASMHGWLYTENPPNDENAEDGEPWEQIEMEPNMVTVAPYGYKAMQMEAKQPVATHGEFMEAKLNEGARPLSMPLNIAMCNSSKYNYASGRLDHQTFFVSIMVDRTETELQGCDRIFERWIQEAQLIPSLLPPLRRYRYAWMWPGFPHADPEKEARALDILLKNGGENLRGWFARQGRDSRKEIAIRKAERVELPPEEPKALAAPQEKNLDENGE